MDNLFWYRLGQKRGGGSSGGSSGGGSVEPIPITADNINEYFDVQNTGFQFVEEGLNFYEPGLAATTNSADANGLAQIILTPKSDFTFRFKCVMNLSTKDICTLSYNYNSLMDFAYEGKWGATFGLPLYSDVSAGDTFDLNVYLFNEYSEAAFCNMVVIPK